MNSNHRIIQWNCRGLRSNYNEILLLLSLLSPSVFCLQEFFLKTDDQLNIRDFNTYNNIYSEGQRPSGGSSILVHFSCPQREIKLVTNLQAVAVSVTLDKEIPICSVYIPSNFHLETEHLDTLLKQLPSPYILVGDCPPWFNYWFSFTLVYSRISHEYSSLFIVVINLIFMFSL